MTLEQFFAEHPRVALGFSGGVDSAYLLYEAVRCGADVRPYYIQTAFQPAFEREDALRLARQLHVDVHIIQLDILACPEVTGNPADRCYHCKRRLFGALQAQAAADGYTVLLDGTNASDDAEDRPGMRALQELQVLSPLRLCGLTKSEIRARSKAAGLFTHDKPAYACLATRIPTGTAIEAPVLQAVERAEALLMDMGYTDFRVRVCGGCARLQVRAQQLEQAFAQREAICAALQPLFAGVLLDLSVRRDG